MSHRGAAHAGRDGWRTPIDFFKGLRRTLDPMTAAPFTVDAAARAGHELAPVAFGPGQARGDAMTSAPWGGPGDRVWINPPFSGLSLRGGGMVGPWAHRIKAEGERATRGELGCLVALLPGVVDTYWSHMLVKSAETVIVVRGRLSFRDPVTGVPARGNVVGSMVLTWGLTFPRTMGVDREGVRLW